MDLVTAYKALRTERIQAGAALTKCHRPSALRSGHLFLSLEAGSPTSGVGRSVCGAAAAFLPCPHEAEKALLSPPLSLFFFFF